MVDIIQFMAVFFQYRVFWMEGALDIQVSSHGEPVGAMNWVSQAPWSLMSLSEKNMNISRNASLWFFGEPGLAAFFFSWRWKSRFSWIGSTMPFGCPNLTQVLWRCKTWDSRIFPGENTLCGDARKHKDELTKIRSKLEKSKSCCFW